MLTVLCRPVPMDPLFPRRWRDPAMERGLGLDDPSRLATDGRSHGRYDALGTDDFSFHWATERTHNRNYVPFRNSRIQTGASPPSGNRPTDFDVCVADLVSANFVRSLNPDISTDRYNTRRCHGSLSRQYNQLLATTIFPRYRTWCEILRLVRFCS